MIPSNQTSERRGTLVIAAVLIGIGVAAVVLTALLADSSKLTTVLTIVVPVIGAALALLQGSYNIARGIAKAGNGKENGNDSANPVVAPPSDVATLASPVLPTPPTPPAPPAQPPTT